MDLSSSGNNVFSRIGNRPLLAQGQLTNFLSLLFPFQIRLWSIILLQNSFIEMVDLDLRKVLKTTNGDERNPENMTY